MFSKRKLWIAIENGTVDVVLSLIASATDIDDLYNGVENETGQTFLHHALNCAQPEIALALLDAGADASILDFNGNSSLYYFVKSRLYAYSVLFKRLIERGADVNKRIAGYTPLYLSFLKMPTVSYFLLTHSADVFAKPYLDENPGDVFFDLDILNNRYTPYLSLAILNNDMECFLFLINHKELIDKQDSLLQTPAMISVLNGNIEMLEILINAGSSMSVQDFYNRTLMDYIRGLVHLKYRDVVSIEMKHKKLLSLISLVNEPVVLKKEDDFSLIDTEEKKKISVWQKIKSFLRLKG